METVTGDISCHPPTPLWEFKEEGKISGRGNLDTKPAGNQKLKM